MQQENQAKYYPHMGREELINYCDLHCKTPRALFRRDMIAQMVNYAGNPDEYSKPEEWMIGTEWHSMHEEMEELVRLARENKIGVESKISSS